MSKDIDIFNDRSERLQQTADNDVRALTAAGFEVTWVRRDVMIYTVAVSDGRDRTQIEWVCDSDYRFFPASPDPAFGYRLHLADVATNKALAAVGRREPRDVLDLLLLHRRFLPLGAIVWAAPAKDPGWTPEGILNWLRRSATRYLADDFDRVLTRAPVDPSAVSRAMRLATIEAQAFVDAMPDEHVGKLFIAKGRVVQPDPDRLEDCTIHEGRRRGSWPTSAEVEDALLTETEEPEPRA